MIDSESLISSTHHSIDTDSNSTTLMTVVAGNCQSSVLNQTNQIRRDRRSSNSNCTNTKRIPSHCHSSSVSAVFDIVVLVVVLFACGYLALPYLLLFYHGVEITFSTVRRDFAGTSVGIKWLCVGFLVLCLVCFAFIRCLIDDRKCDNPNCKGLRNGREFDIKIETEDCLKNAGSTEGDDDVMDDEFFELDVEHYRRLEDRLKKLAPRNGRAMLIFRANCGCSAGRMVVWGPKKRRKMKK